MKPATDTSGSQGEIPLPPFSIRGADVSSLQRAEDLGAKYFDEDGTEKEALQILQDHGVNFIRLRIWVNPANGYNNKDKVIQFAHKVKIFTDVFALIIIGNRGQ